MPKIESARHLATDVVTQDDAEIADMLATVSVPALIASVTLLSGDISHVRGPIRPRNFLHNEFQGDLSEAEKAQLRREALGAICAWRDAGCPSAAAPTEEM